jgi:hypothetical protein
MMQPQTRRAFLQEVGKGMVAASVGATLAADLGMGTAYADQAAETLSFGTLEPLVRLMQETPPAKLLPNLVERLHKGTELRQLVAAAALANARSFGGEDYVGFHTMMAIAPAYRMAQELPLARRALPVLKVLHRNSTRIQEHGGRKNEVLRPVQSAVLPVGRVGGDVLREAVRRRDMTGAERTFAALARGSAEEAFNHLLFAVEDATEVHRVVLPYRAWDLLDVIGREQAHTLLRQSVRYCARNEGDNYRRYCAGARYLVPKLVDGYRLLSRPRGKRNVNDAWVDKFSMTLFQANPDQAADAAAAALADGIVPDAIGEAVSLAANQLVLRDAGRPKSQASANKPVGSIHGDGIGVHACDSANAWRNIARVSNPRNTVMCLILAAYQVAQDRIQRGGEFLKWQPYPTATARAAVKPTTGAALRGALEEAIRGRDQMRACAVVARYGELGHAPRGVFDVLLKYALSEDGALHAEKYYRTVCEEFAATRPAFRWRQLVALARVTASAYGWAAPGYAYACKLLKV